MLTPLHIIFYLFATVAVCSAVAVITVRNPVRSVLSLVVTFFAMAGIWMLLHAEFLSLILLLVYVGAVMTLFLFVVMMLSIDRESVRSGFVRYLPFGIIVVLIITGLTIAAVGPENFGLTQMPAPAPEPPHFSNIRELGAVLYTDYAYPFEIAGVLLLAAIIAAITLTHRGPVRRKVQDANKQISVRPEDRVRLVKMPAAKKEKGNKEE
ncbi:NADH-quinone oxidoreductase subunit J [Aquicella lusitana]|uniref:NADH-quinone oxidoreductase subunit J n=1 Tax=Aquicella lusitana TaxID=254246 RepID=A0A370GUG2_9COXI|nr:NADH-quinone oxidoreductase subunit J [Aquicella lusitana]RDI46920.1 NADH dehydrogenase subunit J [Aquicella lusitana]VVC73811.1 NADH-quinone oxidoreductase subunit J [Aquicella lusitana]